MEFDLPIGSSRCSSGAPWNQRATFQDSAAKKLIVSFVSDGVCLHKVHVIYWKCFDSACAIQKFFQHVTAIGLLAGRQLFDGNMPLDKNCFR